MLGKLGGIWAPKPSAGPHKGRECLPIAIALRNRLKYALTRREVQMICMRRLIKVDGKVRTDMNYPAGFMDTVTIDKSNERFRLLFDHRSKFVLQKISPDEAKFKLLRVKKVAKAKKASIGKNPFHEGQAGAIPYIVTHDGRTIRYPDPKIKVNDTVKFDLESGDITGILPFEVGAVAMVTAGANTGRIGNLQHVERHPGSFEIIHLKDKRGNHFSTRTENVFVIGDHTKPYISIPKRKGISYSVIEERDMDFKKPTTKKGGKK
jgi:small subunit ribosomal protein S4e